jgi:hypothetical protein
VNISQLKQRSEKFDDNDDDDDDDDDDNNNNNAVLVYWSRKQCNIKIGFMIFARSTHFLSSYRLNSEASTSSTHSPLLPQTSPCSRNTHSDDSSKGTCITSINIRMHRGIDSFKTIV